MTNAEHILEKINEFIKIHNRPFTKDDLRDMGIGDYHIKKGLQALTNKGRIRPVVRGRGWVLQ